MQSLKYSGYALLLLATCHWLELCPSSRTGFDSCRELFGLGLTPIDRARRQACARPMKTHSRHSVLLLYCEGVDASLPGYKFPYRRLPRLSSRVAATSTVRTSSLSRSTATSVSATDMYSCVFIAHFARGCIQPLNFFCIHSVFWFSSTQTGAQVYLLTGLREIATGFWLPEEAREGVGV
ncbi:hypothetical protein B0H19DRAFT_1384684 [Mycena capillaripes]|nr:hypothetical protein B0H19DRAFT_1384684 [Mycena capillaripes]